jgi:glutathione-specific gamma-glutamylcyclotransferase
VSPNPPDWWTDEQRAASLTALLAAPQRPSEIWVFAYGSLMWKPAFQPVASRRARLRGFHRSFCILVRRIRGSEEAPGLMMALDEGGETEGLLLQLDPSTAEADLHELWKRELLSDIYVPQWLDLDTSAVEGAPPVSRAIVFVGNRRHGRYTSLDDGAAAAMIAKAEGSAGRCSDYLFDTANHLEQLGIVDAPIARLAQLVRTLVQENVSKRQESQ